MIMMECVCAGVVVCEAWEFQCATVPLCVLKLFICNGRDDCGDLSDEDDTKCSQLKVSLYSSSLLRFKRTIPSFDFYARQHVVLSAY